MLLLGNVPQEWYNMWEGPEKIQNWLNGIVLKKTDISELYTRARKNTLLTKSVNLGSMIHPSSFLMSLCQQTSREYKISMDISLE